MVRSLVALAKLKGVKQRKFASSSLHAWLSE
ncbi:hypothetical protein L195_g038699, partial [Trifolium pratense]